MTTSRKILAGAVVAAGLAAASAGVYADPPYGYGRGGYGPGMGPGMMHQGGGYGPGMMGGGARGGYGPGAGAGPCAGFGPGAAAEAPCGGYGPGAGACAGGGPRAGFGRGAGFAPTERAAQRLAFLKDQLKITSGQEAAWNVYAEQAKANAATMEAFRAKPPAAAQSATERMEQRAERMNLRAKQMAAMSTAVKDLYAVLTPEQKAAADLHFGGGRLSQGPRGYGWQR